MANSNLYISEYGGLANTGFDGQVAVPAEDEHLADQTVVVGATSTPSAAFQQSAPPLPQPPGYNRTAATKWVLLTADVTCSIAFGPVGAVVATATSRFLPANIPVLCRVPENQGWAVAVISNTG
jgi:hypothetical protein